MTNLVDAAVEYLNAGLVVFPLSGKQPNVAIPGTGWREIAGAVAPDDSALLMDVFMHPATTGIGITIPDGMAVVDIDGEEGARAFRELTAFDAEGVLDTAIAETGRGLHLWYATGRPVRSTKLAEKLDLKGSGGYVAAPPSVHPSGSVYTWLSPLVNEHGIVSVSPMPEAILSGLLAREEAPTAKPWSLTIAGKPLVPDRGGTMDGLARKVAEAADGERNNVVNWAAWRAREHGFTRDEVERALIEASSLPAHEVRQTVRSAFRG